MTRSWDPQGAETAAGLEAALCRIVGIEAARVAMANGEIHEIHIVAAPGSRAKHMMRDVRSYLAAALGIEIDHKKISIAVRKSCSIEPPSEREAVSAGQRIELQAVEVQIERMRAAVTVRLLIQGEPLAGRAEGPVAAGEVERLLVEATLAALAPLWPPALRVLAGELAHLGLGRGEVLVTELRLLEAGGERRLIAAAPLDGERDLVVVTSVLGALEPLLAPQAPRGWTEVHVRAETERPPVSRSPVGEGEGAVLGEGEGEHR